MGAFCNNGPQLQENELSNENNRRLEMVSESNPKMKTEKSNFS